MRKSIAFVVILFVWLASCKHEIINPGGVDPQPDSTGTGTNTCDTTHFKFAANVAPILNAHCTSCHNTADAAANGGVDLSNYAGVLLHTDHIPIVIQWLPGQLQMPQGGPKLSDCNIKIIQKWIQAGAQND